MSIETLLGRIDIKDIIAIGEKAGTAIMEIYNKDFSVAYKGDASPLTEADIESNEIITRALNELPIVKEGISIPILSEEGRDIPYAERKEWECFWLIDPIDGTKEFIKKNGEFTVNIALVYRDTPVLGVVYAPALGDMYYAKKGEGAYKNGVPMPLKTNDAPEKKLRVVASKSHLSEETQAFIDEMASKTEAIEQVSKGSSLKLCMVAEGDADVYPRLAPTMEWDTAAAHAVVLESGKQVLQFESRQPVVYNKEDLLNPWFLVGDAAQF